MPTPTPETIAAAFETRGEFLRFLTYFLEKLIEADQLEGDAFAAARRWLEDPRDESADATFRAAMHVEPALTVAPV
jgi:hypothetical protein